MSGFYFLLVQPLDGVRTEVHTDIPIPGMPYVRLILFSSKERNPSKSRFLVVVNTAIMTLLISEAQSCGLELVLYFCGCCDDVSLHE